LPADLRDQLEQLAEQDRRPLATFVRLALEDYASEQRRGERSNRGNRAA
jgi:predicted DNA-binding protein